MAPRKRKIRGRNDPTPNNGNNSRAGNSPTKKTGGSNTPSFPYIDSATGKSDCAKNKDKIDKECKPEEEAKKAERLKAHKGKDGLLAKMKLPSHSGKSKNPNSQWINDHCEFLMVKPSSPDEMLKELTGIKDQMVNGLVDKLKTSGLEALKSRLENKLKVEIEKAIAKKVAKLALKNALIRGGSFLLGPEVGIPVNILMSADSAADAVQLAQEASQGFPQLTGEFNAAKAQLENALKEIEDTKKLFDKYKNKDGQFVPGALVSDMMYGAAELNPCIRARRCSLVPYNQTENPASKNGKGCCPGQSGHHVLPSSMFKGCAAYKEGQAPTICVEGVNNSHGSHGHIHRKLGRKLGEVMTIGGQPTPPGAAISKKDAIDAGAKSVQEAFPESACDPDCIKAQLRKFYDKLNCTAHNKSGEPETQTGGSSGNP